MVKSPEGAGSMGLVLMLLLAAGCGSLSAETAYAFVDFTVVPMTAERLVPHQTVVVRGRSIEAVDSVGEVEPPTGAVVIDGRGRYLMPGLVDMHAHITDRGDLVLLLAHGVTSVRNMAEYPGWTRLMGYPNILALRARVEQGELRGPTIYIAGPVLEGSNPVSPLFTVMKDAAEAERAVRRQHDRGYDLVKVYDKLPPEVYERILRVAAELHVPVVGHVPKAMRMTRALHEAGARLVAGTDMNFVGVFPGASLHRELEDLVGAGLSSCDDIACATVNAAECLGRRGELGTVERGGRADLILLEADPFADVGAVRLPLGVMVRGQWLPREDLERMVDGL